MKQPQLIRSAQEMGRRWSQRARRLGKRIGLVPTMGALHEGHASLVRAARRENGAVVVSIFVNPLQFGPGEDFLRYPRDLSRDLHLLRQAGADVVFAPSAKSLYPDGFSTRIGVEPLGSILEGKIRPGHFGGVATVVMKLLHIVQPHVLYLGRKDYQQAVLISRMIRDLDAPVRVRVLPTVREANGLALSSRNAYLSPAQRHRAGAVFQALQTGAQSLRAQPSRPRAAERAMRKTLTAAGLSVDYTLVADPRTLAPARSAHGRVVLLAAAGLEKVRLIDNLLVDVP
jgi:pantoate--beta-alanine ligase